MSRRQFIKLLISMLTVAIASIAGLWRWLGGAPGKSEPPGRPLAHAPGAPPPDSADSSVVSAEPLLSFMVLSDTHVNGAFAEQSDKLRKALGDVAAFEPKIDALLITGDITDAGSESDYREYDKIVKEFKTIPPIHANMGNHDYYGIWIDKDGQWNKDAMPNGKSDALSRKLFQDRFGLERVYHDFYVNGYHIIMLSQETYVQEKPEVGEGAWYSDEQLDWFRKALEPHRDGSPVFVMIHQPLPAAGQDGGSGQLIRAKEFRAILEPYKNAFVFSGHRHQNFRSGQHYTPETFHWFHNASVGRTRPAPGDGAATSQGLFVQVYADRVELRAREFMDRSWIEEGSWTVPLAK
ncbi:metallophosphoesterase [Paenibacillus sp. GYB003]|uniref:metallophosphoesterase n=1 Tax=Paenibacillus sp. GYB003 TaxID=2994392 RepID=UPI002F96BE45